MKNLKMAFRNLLKGKVVSSINIAGLTLGILVSLLLLTYVSFEKNTDKFLPEYDKLQVVTFNDNEYVSKKTAALMKEKLGEYGPITYVKESWAQQTYLSVNERKIKVGNVFEADSSFFQVFGFKALFGNPGKGLGTTNQIVLTKKMANKLFGNVNPVGRMLNYNTSYQNEEPLEVTAVLDELPLNTAWNFDVIISYPTSEKISWYKSSNDRWGGQNFSVFWKLNKNVEETVIKAQLGSLSKIYQKESGMPQFSISIKPYKNNYFEASRSGPAGLKHGDSRMLMVLTIIAILIITIACINYINLSTAQREKRNKGIAIIKMIGGTNRAVFRSFLTESFIMLFFVVILVLLVSPLAVNLFNKVMNTSYPLNFIITPFSLLLLFALIALSFFVTGCIPGFIYSRNKALELLKPKFGAKKSFSRNILPIFQFTISIALIICLLAMRKQNNFMLNQSTGFEKEHVVYASMNEKVAKNIQSFKAEIGRIPAVADITFADGVMGQISQNWGADMINKGDKKEIQFTKLGVSPDFFKFFNIRFKEGASFLRDSANFDEVILNECAMREFGIQEINDAKIMEKSVIVGVVKDFNFKSAHNAINPIAFFNDGKVADAIFIKLSSGNYLQTRRALDEISRTWDKLSPNLPFDYQFLDESWNALYFKEIQFQRIFNYASIISIFLACLGLFGLSIFVAEQKIKEIGIRKVNGATIAEILTLLNRSFVKWIAIAFVIATPIAYYAMHKWLQTFAYKTPLSWWIFALAGVIALTIALLTVSWQSWRAATRNPVEALRYE